ncbi:MAG: M23 family metallopeptidase, partial [Candidatus Colwellbacteria bacterium]|nr:M23 family metallopeptidase [Candidatus Colwellbacteria bacterium]
FGYTSFAAAGGYGGKRGHNGIDFRGDTGTPVFSAERGIVEAVGDTDIGCRGASYGKWVLIRHPNNLSTLYAHLSAIIADSGEKVARGDRIGLSGKSGYATGPHLHFGVFAAQAVEIKTIVSRVCGRNMTLPVAGSDPVSGVGGYLNPLDYL